MNARRYVIVAALACAVAVAVGVGLALASHREPTGPLTDDERQYVAQVSARCQATSSAMARLNVWNGADAMMKHAKELQVEAASASTKYRNGSPPSQRLSALRDAAVVYLTDVATFAGYLASPAEDDATNKARYEAGKATIGAERALAQALSTMKAHD